MGRQTPDKEKQPRPKRDRVRRALILATGLTLHGELAQGQPTPSYDTKQTTETQPTKPKETNEKEALRARLESFTFITGIVDPKFANPDDMYTNKFTPEFIDWLLAGRFAEQILQSRPPSEQFNNILQSTEAVFISQTQRNPRIQEKMSKENAETYIQFLKDTEIVREE